MSMDTHKHVLTHVCILLMIYKCIYMYTYICINIYIYMYNIHIHMYIIHIHMYNIHIHIYISTCKHARISMSVSTWTLYLLHDYLVCLGFTSWQHLRSYQVEDWLVTVRTHGDFISLPHWETRPPGPGPHIPLSHIILTLSQPVLALS